MFIVDFIIWNDKNPEMFDTTERGFENYSFEYIDYVQMLLHLPLFKCCRTSHINIFFYPFNYSLEIYIASTWQNSMDWLKMNPLLT
jgi:hypothetical protein